MVPLPPPIRSNQPDSFAWRVLAKRHPELLRQITGAHPFGPAQRERIAQLLDEISGGVIERPRLDLPGGGRWNAWIDGHAGQSWFDVPFLMAENIFYRKLLEATGYFGPGPWQGVDPFQHLKAAELETVGIPDPGHISAGGSDAGQALLLAAVWGNQADLGFRITAQLDAELAGQAQKRPGSAGPGREAGLIADDSQQVWDWLTSAPPGPVLIVTDNTGPELVADLMLTGHLLSCGLARRVSLHVKPAPYFVSDATTTDIVQCLRAIERSGMPGQRLADRLKQAAASGNLLITTHEFYFAPLTFHQAPDELVEEYRQARLVILKGDLNYRRLVGDCAWPATTQFADAVSYFAAPVAVLRTLKSDVVVGLDQATLSALDASGQPWRTSGAYAVVQAQIPES